MTTIPRARLADVARLAAVSPSIASRVLNGDTTLSVREDTRRRVHDAAARLQYRPHAGARAVRAGMLGAVGMLIPDLTQPAYARMVRGAVARANERGVVVLVGEDPGTGPLGAEAEAMVARMISERRIDGLLMGSMRPDHPVVRRLAEAALPHVFINRRLPGSGRNVSMDDALASRVALEHLHGLGHRRVGLVAGPPGMDPSERRLAGFRAAAADLGLDDQAVVHAPFTSEGGYDGVLSLFRSHTDLTAVYTSNFGQALGALAGLHHLGRRVPTDCSLITYDDLPMAAFADPPITAIDMPMAEMGAAALDCLLDQLAGGPSADVVVPTRPEVVVRASTGPPPTPEVSA